MHFSHWIILIVLLSIMASLGSGLYYLVKGNSAALSRSLTLRILLSLALFIGLWVAYVKHQIEPHSLSGIEFKSQP